LAHYAEDFLCRAMLVDYPLLNLSKCVPLSRVDFNNSVSPGSIDEMRFKISLEYLPRDIA